MNDMPAKNDTLGLQRYYDAIASFVNECDTPLTVAIQGGWGTGKTSALKMIEDELDKERTTVIWFDTWKYAVLKADDSLVALLLNAFKDKIDELLSGYLPKGSYASDLKSAREKICGSMGKMFVSSVMGDVAIDKLGDTLGGGIKGALGRFMQSDETDTTKDDIQETIDTILKVSHRLKTKDKVQDKGLRLVVFVDDLDRLEPIRALEFLEGIKNFVDCKNCVFVLAVDDKVVRRGIDQKYGIGERDEARQYTKHFFDKIIQVPFKMREDQYDFDRYIREEKFLAKYPRQEDSIPKYSNAIRALDAKNPRTIKRVFHLMDLYGRIKSEAGSGESEIDPFHLFLILLLQTTHEDLLRELLKDASVGRLATVIDDPSAREFDGLRLALGAMLVEQEGAAPEQEGAAPEQEGATAELGWDFSESTKSGFVQALKQFAHLIKAQVTNRDEDIAELLMGKKLERRERVKIEERYEWQVEYYHSTMGRLFLLSKYKTGEQINLSVYKPTELKVSDRLKVNECLKDRYKGDPDKSQLITFFNINHFSDEQFRALKGLLEEILEEYKQGDSETEDQE